MSNREKITDSVEREIALLQAARDELKLQVHLAKSEAKDEWKKLEGTYAKLEDELNRARNELKEPLREIGEAAKGLVGELTRGYARLRSTFRDAL